MSFFFCYVCDFMKILEFYERINQPLQERSLSVQHSTLSKLYENQGGSLSFRHKDSILSCYNQLKEEEEL
jgi:hypothetical protein